MNINKTKKILWLAPELTRADLIYSLFYQSGFEKIDNPLFPNRTVPYSQDDYVDSEFDDFEIISSIRNPYDRVVQIYLEYEIKPAIPITKDLEPKLITFFQNWVETIFEKKKMIVSLNDWGKDVTITKVLKKFLFRNRLPDKLIRCENIVNDLDEIKTIIPIYDLQRKRELEEKIYKVSNGLQFNYKNFYNFEIAKVIYNYYFNQFHLAKYDPFSFTDSTLTLNEKNKFLYDTF